MAREGTNTPQGARLAVGDAAMLLAPAAMLCALLCRSVWDVDIFWQLKLGELILHAGAPVRQEPFAVTHLGQPLAAVAWLGQALFAAARQIGGWTGLRLFDALCWCGGFWAVAAACRRQGAGGWSVALALGLAFVAALPAASIRPQSFGALCFGLLLALLKHELRVWQTIALAVPLLVLWQNLHPSVSIAAVALGAHALGGWLAWWRDRDRVKPWAATILAPLALAAMFATPDGVGILAVSARNAQASIAVGASEWLPLWTPANHANAVPVMAVVLFAFWASLRADGRRNWSDILVMLALLAMTVTAYRFVLFWAAATVPLIATARQTADQGGGRRWLVVVASLILAALATTLVRPTHFSDNLPLAAAARLHASGVQGTVYTEPEFAGVLIDTGYPRWRVTLDGRYYRYTDAEWARYGEVLAGTYRLGAIERRYRPAAFVLRPSHTTWLCDQLDRAGSGWRRIYRDAGVAVWVPENLREEGDRARRPLRRHSLPSR